MNNKQGTYEYIDIDYVLAGCKSQLGLRQTTIYDSYLKDAINQILKELRSFATQSYFVSQIEVDHTGVTPKAKLPDNFIRFTKTLPIVYVNAEGKAISGVNDGTVDLIVTDGEGSVLSEQTLPSMINPLTFSSPVFVNNAFFANTPYGNGSVALSGTVNVVDGWLYFSENVIAEFVKIAYLGTNISEETGDILIPAYAELALRYGASEMWCNTEFSVTGDNRYLALARDYYRKYAMQKAKAKVIPLMPDSLEYQFINGVMKTLI